MELIGSCTFNKVKCDVVLSQYPDKKQRYAIRLVHAKNGSPVAVATLNLPKDPLPADHVHIKHDRENMGIVEALETAGIIKSVTEFITSAGLVMVAKLLIKEGV